jgi:flagellar biosynthesis protein FlhB
MIAPSRNIKITALVLAFLFMGYYAGATLFYHSHTDNRQVISHSHPYTSRNHTHTSEQLQLISFLSVVIMTLPAVIVFWGLLNIFTGVFLFTGIPSIYAAKRTVLSLRAPPVM